MDKQKLIMASGAVAATAAALAGATAYLSTQVLVNTALDREMPKIAEQAGEKISGTLVSRELLRLLATVDRRLSSRDTQTVQITAYDGTPLVGHWYPAEKPERMVVAMHGWRSSWGRDFGLVADFFHDHHCSVLYAEQRGQGRSGGDYIGFGVTERFDCLEWVRWVNASQGDALPIYLCGLSMGATTVLMAAGLDLPANVHGVIADCGFTSPDAIWTHIANNNLHMTYRLRRRIAAAIYERKTQTEDFCCSTVDAMQKTHVPVMLVHGTDDHFVPVEMTYENYHACNAPKRLLVVQGADHGMSYLTDPTGYETAVKQFWREFDHIGA